MRDDIKAIDANMVGVTLQHLTGILAACQTVLNMLPQFAKAYAESYVHQSSTGITDDQYTIFGLIDDVCVQVADKLYKLGDRIESDRLSDITKGLAEIVMILPTKLDANYDGELSNRDLTVLKQLKSEDLVKFYRELQRNFDVDSVKDFFSDIEDAVQGFIKKIKGS